MYRKLKISFYTISILCIVSCVSKKNITYFQFDEVDQGNVNNDYQLTFKSDDLLQILVTSESIEASQPFNLPIVAVSKVGDRMFNQQPQIQSYLIDSEGYIEFPILGKIKLGGLTRMEAIQTLKDKLSPAYLKDPVININISNFKVTVQGDVQRPGTFTIPNERISIFDALGLAGDLNISGRRDNVLVIREENGQKNQYRLDLRSNTVLTSPAYYLQQNDVIYIEPNNAKMQDSSYTRSTGLFISLGSVVISLIAVLAR